MKKNLTLSQFTPKQYLQFFVGILIGYMVYEFLNGFYTGLSYALAH